jgi:hypothetical protein
VERTRRFIRARYQAVRYCATLIGPPFASWLIVSSALLRAAALGAVKLRNWFSPDLAALLSAPIIMGAIAVLGGWLFPVVNWLQHPTGLAWLWALGIATGTSIFGIVLLFLAKLSQYRAGAFLRVGCDHLAPRQQRLYRLSFWLIVPSVIVLVALLSAVHRLG